VRRWPSARAAAGFWLAAAIVVSTTVSRAATARGVTLRAADNVMLAGTLYEASARPAPAVVFLHMLGRSGADWQSVANQLADAGIHALALDFRGHGASEAGPRGPTGEQDLSKFVLDVQAARAYLMARPDLASRVGLAGASVGANAAILAAAADAGIRSLALLSPALDYRSLRVEAAMRQYGDRPALLVAGTDDPYALRSLRALALLGGGLRETRTLDHAGHGTTMLGREADLSRTLVDWFQRTLL